MRSDGVRDSVQQARAALDMHELTREDGFTDAGAKRGGWFRVTGATPISEATNRWEYTVVEVVYKTAGTFVDRTNGFTGTAYVGPEGLNDADTIGASDEDPADWPSGVSLNPLGPGPHWGWFEVDCVTGDQHVILVSPNNPGGSCEAS